MYTSVMLFALTGVAAPAADAEKLFWQSYASGQQQGERQQMPLCVVLGSGRNGWEKLSQTGKLSEEARQLLMSKYIPVYVDTSTPEGKRLATAFQMPSGQGIVISDRTGALQAFWHEGSLPEGSVVSNLERYADSERPVSYTETNPDARTSYYQPAGTAPGTIQTYPTQAQPYIGGVMGYYGGFGGFGGGGCPNCGGGGRRR